MRQSKESGVGSVGEDVIRYDDDVLGRQRDHVETMAEATRSDASEPRAMTGLGEARIPPGRGLRVRIRRPVRFLLCAQLAQLSKSPASRTAHPFALTNSTTPVP